MHLYTMRKQTSLGTLSLKGNTSSQMDGGEAWKLLYSPAVGNGHNRAYPASYLGKRLYTNGGRWSSPEVNLKERCRDKIYELDAFHPLLVHGDGMQTACWGKATSRSIKLRPSRLHTTSWQYKWINTIAAQYDDDHDDDDGNLTGTDEPKERYAYFRTTAN